jgi:DNA/RNA endonuclease YhcR with UshA esterase domain
MKRCKKLITYAALFVLCLLILIPISHAQQKINAEDSYKYVGQTKTVCGVVASTFYSYRSRGHPTFLNLNKPHQNQILTIVIWGSDRGKFTNPPERFFKGKRVCVTGLIETYGGKPEIVVHDPSQIRIGE